MSNHKLFGVLWLPQINFANNNIANIKFEKVFIKVLKRIKTEQNILSTLFTVMLSELVHNN